VTPPRSVVCLLLLLLLAFSGSLLGCALVTITDMPPEANLKRPSEPPWTNCHWLDLNGEALEPGNKHAVQLARPTGLFGAPHGRSVRITVVEKKRAFTVLSFAVYLVTLSVFPGWHDWGYEYRGELLDQNGKTVGGSSTHRAGGLKWFSVFNVLLPLFPGDFLFGGYRSELWRSKRARRAAKAALDNVLSDLLVRERKMPPVSGATEPRRR
jgi:hypothetical protein